MIPDFYTDVQLNDKGKENFQKLFDANQLIDEGDDVDTKNCIECKKPMDWRLGDPIRLRTSGYRYRERHYGECLKIGQNDKVSIF